MHHDPSFFLKVVPYPAIAYDERRRKGFSFLIHGVETTQSRCGSQTLLTKMAGMSQGAWELPTMRGIMILFWVAQEHRVCRLVQTYMRQGQAGAAGRWSKNWACDWSYDYFCFAAVSVALSDVLDGDGKCATALKSSCLSSSKESSVADLRTKIAMS